MFKRIIVLGLVLFAFSQADAALAQGITWDAITSGQWPTVAWDAVTTLTDGDPIPPAGEASLSYNVFIKNYVTGVIVSIATGVTATQQQIALPRKGKYLAGVQSSVLYTGETTSMISETAWSDNVASCQNGVTFGFKWQTGANRPGNLRR